MLLYAMLFALTPLIGAYMPEEDQKKEAERLQIERLLEPYVESGFVGEARDYAKVYSEYQTAIQSYPPKPEKPKLALSSSEFWKKVGIKYGDGAKRGLFYLQFWPDAKEGGNVGVSSLMHSVFKNGAYSCQDFLDFAKDKSLPSGMRTYALAYVKQCMKADPKALVAEMAPFAGEAEGDEIVRNMALGILSQTNEADSGPAATYKLLQSENLRDVTLAIPALWKRPDPAVLPALKKALSRARAARPYPLHDVQKITEAIAVCRGSESIEKLVYDSIADALFWDFRFPNTDPPTLLINLTGRLSNSLSSIKTAAAVEYSVRMFIHATAHGTELDRLGARFLKQVGEGALGELKAGNPGAIWSIWGCSISGDEICASALRGLISDSRPEISRAAKDALDKLEQGKTFPDVRGRLAVFESAPLREMLDLGDKVEVIRPAPSRKRLSFIRRLAQENGSWVLENDLRLRKISDAPIIWRAEWVDDTRMAFHGPDSLVDFTVVDMVTGRNEAVRATDWGHLRRRWFEITVPDVHQERLAEFIVENFYPGTTLAEASLSDDGKHLAFVLALPGQAGLVGAAFVHDVGTERFRFLAPVVGRFIWRGNVLVFAEGSVRGGSTYWKGGRVFEVAL